MDGINNFEQAVSAIKLFGKPHWTNKRQGHRTWKWCVLYSTSPSRKAQNPKTPKPQNPSQAK
jgi:hypothetical protein